MRKELTDNLLCPYCLKSNFELTTTEEDELEITTGLLTCSYCKKTYPIKQGILHLHRNDYSWNNLVSTEATGWIERNEPGPVEMWDLLPFHGEGIQDDWGRWYWKVQSRSFMFNMGLLHSQYKGKKGTFLEPGSQLGWISKHLSKEFPEMTGIATDIFDDISSGLGVSKELIKLNNSFFERVIQDVHTPLLKEESVDFIFADNTLHHYEYLEQALKQMASMMKSDGLFIGLEPIHSYSEDKKTVEESHPNWVNYRIRERCYYFSDYLEAFERAGFSNIIIIPFYVIEPRERTFKFDNKMAMPYYPTGSNTRKLLQSRKTYKTLFDEMCSFDSSQVAKRFNAEPCISAMIYASKSRDLTDLLDNFINLYENRLDYAEHQVKSGEPFQIKNGLHEINLSISCNIDNPMDASRILKIDIINDKNQAVSEKTLLAYQFAKATGAREFSFYLYGNETETYRTVVTPCTDTADYDIKSVSFRKVPEATPINNTAFFEFINKRFNNK